MIIHNVTESGLNRLYVVDNFLSSEEAQFWTKLLDDDEFWDTENYSHGLGYSPKKWLPPQNVDANKRISSIVSMIGSIVEQLFEEPFLIKDQQAFRRYSPGDRIGWHHDASDEAEGIALGFRKNEPITSSIGLIDVSSILYYNDNFDGGNLRFGSSVYNVEDAFDFEIRPKPGMLVIFPATAKYGHGVSRITSGHRYISAHHWIRAKTIAVSLLKPEIGEDWRSRFLWPEKVDAILGMSPS